MLILVEKTPFLFFKWPLENTVTTPLLFRHARLCNIFLKQVNILRYLSANCDFRKRNVLVIGLKVFIKIIYINIIKLDLKKTPILGTVLVDRCKKA